VGAPTSISDILQRPEDCGDLRSLLRFLVPALFGDLPDRRGDPRGIKFARFRRPFALRDHNCDIGVRKPGKGHLPGDELETKIIRTWTYRTFGKQMHLHNYHGQGVHIGLVRWFSLFDSCRPGVKKFGGAVADGAAVVGS
jgi:hypothetical protein